MRKVLWIVVGILFLLPATASAWSTEGGSARRANAKPGVNLQPPFEHVWKRKVVTGRGGLLEHGVTVAAGRVYGATINGTTFALDARTGHVYWKRSLGRRLATSPTYHEGYLYVQAKASSIGARLWKINARTGATRWNRRLGPSGSEGGPLVVKGKVIITNGKANNLRAYHLNGRLAWRRSTCQAWQAPTWTGRYIVAADYCGRVRAFTPRGKLRWITRVHGSVYAASNSVGGRLYVHTKAGLLYAINARTGRRIWVRRTGRGIGYPECAATKTRVWCANGWGDNRISQWNSNGRRLWTRRLPGQVMGAVVLTKRMLWTGTHDGVRRYNRNARVILGMNPKTGRTRVRLGSSRYDSFVTDGRKGYLIHYRTIEAIR